MPFLLFLVFLSIIYISIVLYILLKIDVDLSLRKCYNYRWKTAARVRCNVLTNKIT